MCRYSSLTDIYIKKSHVTYAVLRVIGRQIDVVDVHDRSRVHEHGSMNPGVVEKVKRVRLNGFNSVIPAKKYSHE